MEATVCRKAVDKKNDDTTNMLQLYKREKHFIYTNAYKQKKM